MDAIRLSDDDVVSLDQVAPGVAGLRILFVNLFGVEDGDGWTLVDAGLYLSAGRIRRWAEKHFGSRAPRAIVLTHGHFDHVGSLKELAEEWDVPVHAHMLELPYLTGRAKYPAPDPSVGGGMMARLSWMYSREAVDLGTRVSALPAGGTVPTMPAWRWIHTPGHTEGHISLFRDSDATLIVGDAFCTTRQESLMAVARQKPEMHGPPAYYTPDWPAARASVELLAKLRPAVIAPGHGEPMAGADATDALALLAERFDEIAIPEHGRYVDGDRAA